LFSLRIIKISLWEAKNLLLNILLLLKNGQIVFLPLKLLIEEKLSFAYIVYSERLNTPRGAVLKQSRRRNSFFCHSEEFNTTRGIILRRKPKELIPIIKREGILHFANASFRMRSKSIRMRFGRLRSYRVAQKLKFPKTVIPQIRSIYVRLCPCIQSLK
jgi:hypothetical protein